MRTCEKCGGIIGEPFELIAGTPCRCLMPSEATAKQAAEQMRCDNLIPLWKFARAAAIIQSAIDQSLSERDEEIGNLKELLANKKLQLKERDEELRVAKENLVHAARILQQECFKRDEEIKHWEAKCTNAFALVKDNCDDLIRLHQEIADLTRELKQFRAALDDIATNSSATYGRSVAREALAAAREVQ